MEPGPHAAGEKGRCAFKCLNALTAATVLPSDTRVNVSKMAALLERSFIEICGFERETLHSFREITVDLGKNCVMSVAACCSSECACGCSRNTARWSRRMLAHMTLLTLIAATARATARPLVSSRITQYTCFTFVAVS